MWSLQSFLELRMKANFGLRNLCTSVGGAKGSIRGPKRVRWKQHCGGQPSVILPLHSCLLLFSKDPKLPWQYHFKHHFFSKYQYPCMALYSFLIFFPKSLSTINKPWWQLPFLVKFTKLKLTHVHMHAHTHTHIWFFWNWVSM